MNSVKKPLELFDEESALGSLRDGGSGAELYVLEGLAHVVLSGKKVNPVFQAVVNAIVAKAVISGKLPANARGKPANFMTGPNGGGIAERHLELMDGGMNYAAAIEKVANEFQKDGGNKISDRQIERLVAENKSWIKRRMGETVEERKIFRARSKKRADIELSASEAECVARIVAKVDAAAFAMTTHLKNEAQRDHLADLDRLIVQLLKQVKPGPLAALYRLMAQSLKKGNPDDIK